LVDQQIKYCTFNLVKETAEVFSMLLLPAYIQIYKSGLNFLVFQNLFLQCIRESVRALFLIKDIVCDDVAIYISFGK